MDKAINEKEFELFDYTIYRLETGEIVSSGAGYGTGVAEMWLEPGTGVLPVRVPVEGHYIDRGQVLAMPEKTEEGVEWDWATKAYTRVPVSRNQLAERIAERRWQREVGGITWQGIPVNTERDARTLLEQAIDKGERYGIWPAEWKFADGQFRVVTAAMLRDIEIAVTNHVKDCFAWESAELKRLVATPDADLARFEV